MFRRTIKRLAALYLAAVVLFLLSCGVGCARGAYYRGRGLAEHRTLTAQDVTYQSIRPYDTDIPEGETWFVSTDTDPQLLWEGDAWVERVVLHVQQHKPATGVELYYRAPGQTDFDTRHVVYGVPDGSGGYVFDLRGQHVSGLRIDPDSVGGVPFVLCAGGGCAAAKAAGSEGPVHPRCGAVLGDERRLCGVFCPAPAPVHRF